MDLFPRYREMPPPCVTPKGGRVFKFHFFLADIEFFFCYRCIGYLLVKSTDWFDVFVFCVRDNIGSPERGIMMSEDYSG